jgi:hypothetical protein
LERVKQEFKRGRNPASLWRHQNYLVFLPDFDLDCYERTYKNWRNGKMNKLDCAGKFVTGVVISLFLSTAILPAYAENGKGCLTITKEQIADTLKKMNVPAAEIVGIKNSPLDGICEIEVNSKGSAGIFYTDLTLNYVIFGSLHDTRSMVNLTAVSVQKLSDKKRVDLARITLNEGLAIGVKGASKKVIIFTDPD